MSSPQIAFSRERIAAIYPLIRNHVRHTPVVQVDGADFGWDGVELYFKLELLQHSGSFKARGAFTNLLTREIPTAGVAAASGGRIPIERSGVSGLQWQRKHEAAS